MTRLETAGTCGQAGSLPYKICETRAKVIALLLGLVTALSGQVVAQPTPHGQSDSLLTALREDAELRDVFFVNPRLGWAVGDHGIILRTADGGQSWIGQESGVACPLASVFFLDETTGWAAGGRTHPYTHTSEGVLLRTHDGGHTWVSWKRALLPALLKVWYADAKQGWAIGRTSDAFPHALFTTDDGGRTWTPLPLAAGQPWLTGGFLDALHGAVTARDGMLGVVRNRAVAAARGQFPGIRSFRDVVLTTDRAGCAVGDGGLIVTTRDVGNNWQDRSAALPGGPWHDFDFRAVASASNHIWIAGSPGTHISSSTDGGATWTAAATGQSLPLKALHFVDQQHGWAVGALGTILATSDGGRTWQRQRSKRRRAAWLGIFSDAEKVPLEVIAQLSAGHGYLGVVDIVARRDIDSLPSREVHRDQRIREALTAAGASSVQQAWQFPARDARLAVDSAQLTAIWDAVNRRPGRELLERRLVNQLRLWRPDVVITMPPSPNGTDPLSHLINQAVLGAVRKAAAESPREDDSQPGHLHSGLAPWSVKKVYAVLPARSVGTTSVASDQLVPGLGQSLADFVARPRGLIQQKYRAAPSSTRLQLILNDLPAGQGGREIFGGLNRQAEGEARRPKLKSAVVDIRQIRRAASRRQIVQALVASTVANPAQGKAWMAQLNNVTSGMGDRAAAEVLLHLATRYYEQGNWTLAAEAYEWLADRYEAQPAAAAAMAWLVRYYASAEAAHVAQAARATPVRTVRADPGELDGAAVQYPEQAGNSAKAGPVARAERAGLWAKRLQAADYMLFARPDVRIPLGAAQRVSGQSRQAGRTYLAVQRSRPRDAWWQCAAFEQSLADGGRDERNGPALPQTLGWLCRRTDEKPRLDGRLDEPCWGLAGEDDWAASSSGMRLQSAFRDDRAWPAIAVLCFDDEYLYLGVACRQASGAAYLPSDKPRPRDADLDGSDRVDLCLDLDRDRATYYRFTLDYRGWTSEACWGHRGWDPTWFVAASTQGTNWVCEAAIPLAELTSTPPQSKEIWAVGLQRVVPGVGFQSWTQPSSPDILPEGFGHLKFE